ncbi:hypothetical protein HUK80_12915 [Flavobacterium sp. MAH-1]|uniref:Type VI secretion system (T6SS), amidase effector protein 4 n=1 Tax=Flavobacterium agri TaxID=2743471 RepID=A0A7Y8Y5T6_9FLAO|nr:T6SS effector amidase Tae4 family protein [Flavobacterium agri]NUY81801.1 hypothetical protein [Flavobacterium agri]NYA71825.1 hypothetical protein [Flavobacterium agri]
MSNCSTENDVITSRHVNHQSIEWTATSFEKLSNDIKFNMAMKGVEQILIMQNTSNKTVIEETNGFTIDSSIVYTTTVNNKVFYDVGITRQNLPEYINYVENLHIEIDSANSIKAAIFKYDLNDLGKAESAVSFPINFDLSTAKTELPVEECDVFDVYEIRRCTCDGHHWPGDPDCRCTEYGGQAGSITYLGAMEICTGGGSGGGGPIGGGGTGGGSGGGGYTSTSSVSPYSYISARKKSLRQNAPVGLGATKASWLTSWVNANQGEGISSIAYDYLESDYYNPAYPGLISTATTYPATYVKNLAEAIDLAQSSNQPFQNVFPFYIALSEVQKAWLNANPPLKPQIMNYIGTTGDTAMGVFMVSFFMSHPAVTFPRFKNAFLNQNQGKDIEFSAADEAFWNDPNLTFPSQVLPSLANFTANFPSHQNPNYATSTQMYAAVGGAPNSIFLSSGNGNTCALRVSWALLRCGIQIPNIPTQTFLGADGKYYFLGAKPMLKWMKKTFGEESIWLDSSYAGNNGQGFFDTLNSVSGIYVMIPNDPSAAGFDASGHIDLMTNGDCNGGCYFNPEGGVKDIWTLN